MRSGGSTDTTTDTSESGIFLRCSPSMHPRIFDQIERAKSQGVPNLGVSTNGTLLDSRRREAILDSPLDTLLIAIDGTTKEVYERVRLSARHSFEEVVENAQAFLSAKQALGSTRPLTILSIIIMDETEAQLADFSRFWTQAGADEVVFKPFVNWANQVNGLDELTITVKSSRSGPARANPCRYLWESVDIAWNGEPIRRLRRDESAGCNNSSLCAGCDQAPGIPRQRLWPIRR